jgi:phage I-like protein
MPTTTPSIAMAVAACAFEIAGGAPSTAIQLLPAGVIRGKDGRPKGLPGWRMDASAAARVTKELPIGDSL